MDEVDAWRRIDEALQQVGFARDWTVTHLPTFTGQLDTAGLAAEATLQIDDLDFVTPPRIRLKAPEIYGRLIAHVLGAGGDLCYLDGRARVLDRYDPGGTVLSCVQTASEELRKAVAGASDDYFLDDFSAYWNADFLYVDLDPAAKEAEIAWVALNQEPTPRSGVVTAKDGLAPALLARHRHVLCAPDAEPERQPCTIITVKQALRVDPLQSWPPQSLEALISWLDEVAPGTVAALDRQFSAGEGASQHFGLRAPNGLFVLKVDVPSTLRRTEFLETRRTHLWRNLRRVGRTAPVTRMSTVRIDAEYLATRNLVTPHGLMGRCIALIGCGAIGGFLGQQLARSGAGMGGGQLTLYDPDRLMPANLGRHALPMTALNQNKAEALRDHLVSTTPHLSVAARPVDALSALEDLARFDLVIDATGEEAFSIALNHRALRRADGFPATLHVWLHANGLAAEALLRDGPEQACYKCLKPVLSREPRHRIVRPEVTPVIRQNYACGDPLFTPYPISRGVGAAGLALDMTLDWARGRHSPRHRARIFEPESTFQFRDGDRTPASDCPACRPNP